MGCLRALQLIWLDMEIPTVGTPSDNYSMLDAQGERFLVAPNMNGLYTILASLIIHSSLGYLTPAEFEGQRLVQRCVKELCS